VDDAPGACVAQMLCAIVGFEIPAATLAGKFKLSQNRSAPDHEGVRQALAAGDAPARAAAALMPAAAAAPEPSREDPR
jgi:transcriptional regulator